MFSAFESNSSAVIGIVSSWAAMSGCTVLGYYSARYPKLPLALVATAICLMFLPLASSWLAIAVLVVAGLLVAYHFAVSYRVRLIGIFQILVCGLFLVGFAYWGWAVFPESMPREIFCLWLLLPLVAIWPFAGLPLAIRACRRG